MQLIYKHFSIVEIEGTGEESKTLNYIVFLKTIVVTMKDLQIRIVSSLSGSLTFFKLQK